MSGLSAGRLHSPSSATCSQPSAWGKHLVTWSRGSSSPLLSQLPGPEGSSEGKDGSPSPHAGPLGNDYADLACAAARARGVGHDLPNAVWNLVAVGRVYRVWRSRKVTQAGTAPHDKPARG